MSIPAKYQSVVLSALAQAYASSSEVCLLASRTVRGLFPATALGRASAAAAVQAGWLNVVRTETRGKATMQFAEMTPAGSAYLMEQNDPKPLLEQLQRTLASQETIIQNLQEGVRTALEHITALRTKMEQVGAMASQREIVQTRVSVPSWEDRLTEYLSHRQSARPAEDCPLPELFREAKSVAPGLTVGTFHDGLRRLQSTRRIALQPWTGPLHELPEPTLALLQGHSLAFYASALNM